MDPIAAVVAAIVAALLVTSFAPEAFPERAAPKALERHSFAPEAFPEGAAPKALERHSFAPEAFPEGAASKALEDQLPGPELEVAAGTRYGWPLQPRPAVVTPFRAPAHPYGPGHRGVDLAGAPAQPVLAARGGTVVFAGEVAGHGVVSVSHDDGLRTTYQPITPAVVAGAVVAAGAVLGLLAAGHPGCPVAACLHWGVRRDRTEYLDPLVLLRPPVVRLLPVPDPWPSAGAVSGAGFSAGFSAVFSRQRAPPCAPATG